MSEQAAGRRQDYDGTSPFPEAGEHAAGPAQVGLTAAIVVLPFIALGVAIFLAWGRGVTPTDLLLAAIMYVVTGLGVTVGFHRLLTHSSFIASPRLRVALAVTGSMGFQGNVIDWVAVHRRHHAFTDRPGDPHSPYRYGTGLRGQLRGLAHAHLGWLFSEDRTPPERYAPDLLSDPAMRRVARAFPALCALSLALPFLAGWAITGTLYGALTAFLWAGLIRVALLQHVTWSVNSLCHVIGSRPFKTRRHDRSTNLWPLALPSFGESWHNGHHSEPSCARHGLDRGQVDPSAAVIRLFERAGWASNVHWPDHVRTQRRRAGPAAARIASPDGAGPGRQEPGRAALPLRHR